MGEAEDAGERRADLERRLAAVRERIAAACAAAGRDPDRVELMAVTKTVPAADVATLLDLGLTLFGENRAQEAGAKVAEVAALRPDAHPRWHFIGGLQRNKAKAVVAWAYRVESVDSARLADALDRAAARACDDGRRPGPLPVLLQYSVDGDPARGGVPADGLLRAGGSRRRLCRAASGGAHGRRTAGRRPRDGLRRHRRRRRSATFRLSGRIRPVGRYER